MFQNNLTHRTTRLATLTALALAALLSACSSVSLDEPKAKIEDRNSATGQNDGSQRNVAKVDAAIDPLTDPKNALSKRSIYFDFDSFVIREEFRPTIEAHARFLSSNTGRKVSIEGNTDERGSREYNLALGQKRAEAVRKALAALGVSDSQLEAVSFGEEKPRAQGSDEAAWKENRRADITYK